MCLYMATRPPIGTIIRKARERKLMSQDDLARELRVSRSAVNAWENDRSWPRNRIGALESVLGVTLTADPLPSPALAGLWPPQDDYEADVFKDADLSEDDKLELITGWRAERDAYRKRKAARAARSRQAAAG